MTADIFEQAERICAYNGSALDRLEQERRGHLLFLVFAPLLPAVLGVWALWFFLLRFDEAGVGFVLAALVFAGIYLACAVFAYPVFDYDYRKKAKRTFMEIMAGSLGLRYRRGGVIRLGDLYEHHILPPYGVHGVEEGFTARYKDFTAEFQDFKIKPEARLFAFDYRALLSLFGLRGVVIRIRLNKRFRHHTVLIPSFLTHGFMKRRFHEKFFSHEEIRLGYGAFRKNYTLLSTNPVEAHYIYDPAVIERILRLGETLEARWLEISFKDRECVIYAQYGTNFFEIGHLLQPVNILTVERSLAQMQSLQSILDILELNPMAGLGARVPDRPVR